jgi:hypothetical protein
LSTSRRFLLLFVLAGTAALVVFAVLKLRTTVAPAPAEPTPAVATTQDQRPIETTVTPNSTGTANPITQAPIVREMVGRRAVFDIDITAEKIAFVCDASGSMLNKFGALRRELDNAVHGLQAGQSFNIVFFQDQSFKAFDEKLVMATPDNKLKAAAFLADKIVPRGEADPIPGLEIAFQQEPRLIYLLTDGDFSDNAAVLRRLRALNRAHEVRIDTIAFVAESDIATDFTKLLEQIASENGGICKRAYVTDLP